MTEEESKQKFLEHFQKLIEGQSRKFTDSFGNKLVNVHPKSEECLEYGCPIHSPSDHTMKDWPLLWRNDRRIFERIDSEGVGHPDPDTLKFIARTRGQEVADIESVHGCNGMCRGAYV